MTARLRHGIAVVVFCLLTVWHLWPIFPVMATHVPQSSDMCNNTAELVSVMRSVYRHPWTFWRGQYTYPHPYNNALINSNYACGVPYYALYTLTGNPSLSYNMLLLLIFVANAFAVYLLVGEWTGATMAGVLAGAMATFFPHRLFDLADYHYQLTCFCALALWAWVRFLREGGTRRLAVFFAIVAVKAITLDYQTVYLASALAIMIPAGYLAYPHRLRGSWWQFLAFSAALLALLVPFYYPYYINMTRLPSIGWVAHIAGAIHIDCISWEHCAGLFTGLWHNMTHLRGRATPDVSTPLLPGAVMLVLACVGMVWALVAPAMRGRRGLLWSAVVLLCVWSVLLALVPVVKRGEGTVAMTPLARFVVDPPILGFVRNGRAYIHNIGMMLAILGGLMAGDVAAYAWRRGRRTGMVVAGICGVLLLVATLEHTVGVCPYSRMIPARPDGIYAWLASQPHPSPFIEFPFVRDSGNFFQAMNGVLADQPTGVAIGRNWPQMSYFLMEAGNGPLTARKLAMIEASPYRFWVQHGADDAVRTRVESDSSLRYATNFGRSYMFSNPAIERTLPITLCVTQRWNLNLPHVYSVELGFSFTGQYTFVPMRERPVRAQCEFVDAAGNTLATLDVCGELPFMLAGPYYCADIQFTYDPVARRVRGWYRNSGQFNIEKWPGASARCDDGIFAARAIRVRLEQPVPGRRAEGMIRLVTPPGRWPYLFGVPTSPAYQACGFDIPELEGKQPCQKSVGAYSVVSIGRPAQVGTSLVVVAKSALKAPPEPVQVRVRLNGRDIGVCVLTNVWLQYTMPVATDVWQEVNHIEFRYPRTYFPCLLRESYDAERRCAVFASIDVGSCGPATAVPSAQPGNAEASRDVARAAAPPGRPAVDVAEPRATNIIRNGAFDRGLDGWGPWRTGSIAAAHIRVVPPDAAGGMASIRIENPAAELRGVQQVVALGSGVVYRLAATARRADATNEAYFGGRIAVYLPPQPEQELVWHWNAGQWETQARVFTNMVDGAGVIYIHMGYGNVASTGEFTRVRLEQVE